MIWSYSSAIVYIAPGKVLFISHSYWVEIFFVIILDRFTVQFEYATSNL